MDPPHTLLEEGALEEHEVLLLTAAPVLINALLIMLCLLSSKLNTETRLGVDRVKPWSSVRISLGLILNQGLIRKAFQKHGLIVKPKSKSKAPNL